MYELKSFENGFEYLEIHNAWACAKIALQGAHIFEYKQNSKEPLLWLSKESKFELGQAIRGGIPLCWPRFGSSDESLPQHGFARTSMFQFAEVMEIGNIQTRVIFKLKDDELTRNIWKNKFSLEVIFTISDELKIELKTTNMGKEDFMITQALHTYLGISNISNVVIRTLDEKPYHDALSGENQTQGGDIRFSEEVDRVYQDINENIILEDKRRIINIKNSGSSSVVVWNPWIEKCKRMSDMSEEAYKEFVCIESANAGEDFKVLKAGESHSLIATIGGIAL